MAHTDATRIWALPYFVGSPSSPPPIPSSSHPAIIFIVQHTLLISSHLTRPQYQRRRTRQYHLRSLYVFACSHALRRSPPQSTFEASSDFLFFDFVMALVPTIDVRLARGLWTNPANWQIARQAIGECNEWAERVFAGTNADVDMFIW